LVWGIEARRKSGEPEAPDVATALQPISGLSAFHSALNGLVRLATKPVVPRVLNYRISSDRATDRGYVVTYVPVGDHPPYRAELDNKNHFYKRAGSTFYPMEPFDIRDVIFRQHYPKVEVDLQREDVDTTIPGVDVYSLRVDLKNNGPVSLSAFNLCIDIPKSVFREALGSVGGDERSTGSRIYRRVIASHPRPGRMFRLFPDDEMTVFGANQPERLLYFMTAEMAESELSEAKVFFVLYGDNIPPVRGERVLRELIRA
jgi:hypothetical protein